MTLVSQVLKELPVILAFLEFAVYPEKLEIVERMVITENLEVLDCLASLEDLACQEFQENAALQEYQFLEKRGSVVSMETQVLLACKELLDILVFVERMASLVCQEKAFVDDKETMGSQEKAVFLDILDNPAILDSQGDFCVTDRHVLSTLLDRRDRKVVLASRDALDIRENPAIRVFLVKMEEMLHHVTVLKPSENPAMMDLMVTAVSRA